MQSTGSGAFTLTLLVADLNALKANEYLGTHDSNSHLRIEAGNGIRELGGHAELATIANSLPVSSFTSDRTQPTLLGFTLDLDSNTMTFTFDEPVTYPRTLGRTFSLQTYPGIRALGLIYIPSNAVSSNNVTTETTYSFVTNVLQMIKYSYFHIGTSIFNTYIAGRDNFFDFSGNLLRSVSGSQPMQLTTFIEDSTSPSIISFNLTLLNEGNALMVFFFDDIPNMHLHPKMGELTLQNSSCRGTTETFSNADVTSIRIDGFYLYVYISIDDANRLKEMRHLATGRHNTYLSVTPDFFSDTRCNKVNPIVDCQALQVSSYTSESQSPSLTSWSLDMDAGQISMTFDETVDLLTLNARRVIITTDRYCPNGYRLTSTPVTTDASVNFTIQLSDFDLNNLKIMDAMNSIATSRSILYLSANDVIRDMSGNSYRSGGCQTATQVDTFTPDETGPRLRAFSLDMDIGELMITFNEPINPSTLSIPFVSVMNASTAPQTTYTLTSESLAFVQNSTVVTISLRIQDLNNIKAIDNIATSNLDTCITTQYWTVSDLNGNVMNDALPLCVDSFMPDSTQPEILSFDLDLCMEQLVISFSETVNVSSVNPTRIKFQGSSTAPTASITLTGGNTLQENGPELLMRLARNDANRLAGRSIADTFLAVSSNIIRDTSGNEVVAISSSAALQVGSFTGACPGSVLGMLFLQYDNM